MATNSAEYRRAVRQSLARFCNSRTPVIDPKASEYIDGALFLLSSASGYLQSAADCADRNPEDRQTIIVIRKALGDMSIDLGAAVRLLRADNDSAALASIFRAAGYPAKQPR